MKLHHKIVSGAVALAVGSMAFTACTDDVKFGDAFIEKAPGGTVTLDTVFNSAEYTTVFRLRTPQVRPGARVTGTLSSMLLPIAIISTSVVLKHTPSITLMR